MSGGGGGGCGGGCGGGNDGGAAAPAGGKRVVGGRGRGAGPHLSRVLLIPLQYPLKPPSVPGLFAVVYALVLLEGVPSGVLLEAEGALEGVGVGLRARAGVEAEVGGQLSAWHHSPAQRTGHRFRARLTCKQKTASSAHLCLPTCPPSQPPAPSLITCPFSFITTTTITILECHRCLRPRTRTRPPPSRPPAARLTSPPPPRNTALTGAPGGATAGGWEPGGTVAGDA